MSEVSSELAKTEVEHQEPQVADTEASGSATENSEINKENCPNEQDTNTTKETAQMDGDSIEHQHNVTVVTKSDNVDDDDDHHQTKGSKNTNTMLIDVDQQPEDHNNAGDASQEKDSQVHQTKTSDVIDSTNTENTAEVSEKSSEDKVMNMSKSESLRGKEPISTIGIAPLPTSTTTSTAPATTVETQEVSSTRNDDPPKSVRSSSRRPSYNSGRGYAGGYQNYGLTYLPYKSNFEPSENARRKADEFFKTLKL